MDDATFLVGRTAMAWALAKAAHHGENTAFVHILLSAGPEDGSPYIRIRTSDEASCETEIEQDVDLPGEDAAHGGLAEAGQTKEVKERGIFVPLRKIEGIIAELPEGPVQLRIHEEKDRDSGIVMRAKLGIAAANFQCTLTGTHSTGRRLESGWIGKRIEAGNGPDPGSRMGHAPGTIMSKGKTGHSPGTFLADPRDLRDALRHALIAESGKHESYVTQGVMIEARFKGGKLLVQATDGQCLSMTSLPFREPALCEPPRDNPEAAVGCKITRESAASLEAHMRFAERARIIAQRPAEGLVRITLSPGGLIAHCGPDGMNRSSQISILGCEAGKYPDIPKALQHTGKLAHQHGAKAAHFQAGELQHQIRMAGSTHGHAHPSTGAVVISLHGATELQIGSRETRILCAGRNLADGRRVETFTTRIQHLLEHLKGSQDRTPVPPDWKRTIWVSTHRLRRIAGSIPARCDVRLIPSKDNGILAIRHQGRSGSGIQQVSLLAPQTPIRDPSQGRDQSQGQGQGQT